MHKIINNIKLGFLLIFFLFLFISFQNIKYSLAGLIFISLFTIQYGKIKIKTLKYTIPLLVLFFVNIISLFYSDNIGLGFRTIDTQLSLLLLPILISFDSEFYFNNKQKIIKGFIIASIIAILVFIILFIQSGNIHRLINSLEKYNLFAVIRWYNVINSQHPTYISLSFLFSIILIIHSYNKEDKCFFIVLKLIGILVILIAIFLLNSRAILLSTFFVFIYYTIKFLAEHKRIYIYISLILLLSVFSYIIVNSRFHKNIEQIEQGVSTENYEKVDIRISLWKDAYIMWKEKPLFGYGIGDAKIKLIDVHKNRDIKIAFKERYNCHNQFLETATQTGVVGLIVLLLVFAIPFYQAIKKKQELLFLFLSICFINFLFESMLQRLTGVVFFAFWYSFLWFVYYRDDNKE